MFEKGQKVKLLLASNIAVDGFIYDIIDNDLYLKSLENNSTLIIHNYKISLILSKIYDKEVNENKVENNIQTELVIDPLKEIKNTAKDELIDDINKNVFISDSLKDKDLAKMKIQNLKKMLKNQEEKEIREKLSYHSVSEGVKVNYEYPSFFKKPSK